MISREQLPRMVLFASVVQEGSLSGAARRLNLTRSAVSRQIAALEAHLAVRLLNRTTRTLSLTEAGQAFYHSCARMVEEAEAADRAVRRLAEHPVGTLRMSGPVIGHRLLMPLVQAYLDRYPEVKVDITFEDRYVDLVTEGYDLGVRVGHPSDSSLVARRLMPVRQVVVASPAYLQQHGSPSRPADLASHQWLIYSLLNTPDRFTFTRRGQQVSVRVRGRLTVNGGPAIRDAMLAGLGMTLIPSFYVSEELTSGRLVEVLGDYEVSPSQLYAVFPHREYLPLKVRAMVDLLVENLSEVEA